MLKKPYLFIASLIFLSLFSFSYLRDYKPSDKEVLLKRLLYKSLDQAHFKNLEVNDEMSSEAFDMYMKALDPNKRFFLDKDVQKLDNFRYKIDDDFSSDNKIPFLDESLRIYEERIEDSKNICLKILDEPFDFTISEEVETDADKLDYVKSKNELEERWRKQLKLSALVRYTERVKALEEDSLSSQTPAEVETEIRNQLKENYQDMFDLLSTQDIEDQHARYLNAIISVYGPHTEYYPPEKKERFDQQMSGRFEGIGARLQQTGGEIKVVAIIPGSAAWKQKGLKEGDVIMKVAQQGQAAVSVESMSLKNAVKLIKGKKGTTVRLTVRKPDGLIKIVPIERDVVELAESYAKSSVITDSISGNKYGIIHLPSFYADFKGTGGRNSSSDVRQELVKLKKENVEGIILDLRNNGGGSLSDAIEMTGLFIDKGPVVQVKSKVDKPRVLSDKDDRVIYDGPLVVMVNRFSASASEILAAAIQDYKRGVIVGSTSYGKGTVQRFIDLDRLNKVSPELKPLGSLKLTIQKFYRVSGGATQVKGVQPDIFLPDKYVHLDIGEEELPFVMPWDSVKRADFEEWEFQPNFKELKAKSEGRVADNTEFLNIVKESERLEKESKRTLETLSYSDYVLQQEQLNAASANFEESDFESTRLKFTVLPDHVLKNDQDSVAHYVAEEWKNKLVRDIHLEECVNILTDME
ncbi:carboxy terminal-processing peptidase [Sediminitomix flava]|uniref:Carboxyl-terminal processing protease n=1 Tax=Sediminitomix flava TaxID=379075 RepID=A0A315ZFM7_SEDFL|nr:carboxy terminal-processing peptidase [Sediminitomix flava]PWJ43959.1 carboxyl-terminal processing protease [Sediminitomix flava]